MWQPKKLFIGHKTFAIANFTQESGIHTGALYDIGIPAVSSSCNVLHEIKSSERVFSISNIQSCFSRGVVV